MARVISSQFEAGGLGKFASRIGIPSRPAGRLSLAQDGAGGGVLGNLGKKPESRRDGTASHTDASAQLGCNFMIESPQWRHMTISTGFLKQS